MGAKMAIDADKNVSARERMTNVMTGVYGLLADDVHEYEDFANGFMQVLGASFDLGFAILRGRGYDKRSFKVVGTYVDPAHKDLDMDSYKKKSVPADHTLARYLREQSDLYYSSDLWVDRWYDLKWLAQRNNLRSAVFVPISTEELGFVGWLACFREKPAGFTASEISALNDHVSPLLNTLGDLAELDRRLGKKPQESERPNHAKDFFSALVRKDSRPGEPVVLKSDRKDPSEPKDESLKLKRVVIRDFRALKDVSIDFVEKLEGKTEESADVNHMNVILGNNGAAKTSLLRGIAIGLSDAAGAGALIRGRNPDRVMRHGTEKAQIELQFADRKTDVPLIIVTTLQKSASGEVEVTKTTIPSDFPWEKRFVCAYGPRRHIFGQNSLEDYDVLAGLESLFDYSAQLNNPELFLRRLSPENRDKALGAFAKVLELEPGSIFLSSQEDIQKGIRVKSDGADVLLEDAGDGYASTFTWMTDLLARWVLAGRGLATPGDISGVVLIDEIEQHLHPHWQQEIVDLLRRIFPNIQFIVSSHSPLIVANAASRSITENPANLIPLARDEEGFVYLECPPSIDGLTVDQILASEAFGFVSQKFPLLQKFIRRASELAVKGTRRTNEEEMEYAQLKDKLVDRMLQSGESPFERKIIEEMRSRMLNKIEELKAKTSRDNQ